MDAWLNAQADGLAFMFWCGVLALACLGIAAIVQRLRPRHEREFPHVATFDRYRTQAREHDEYAPRRWL